MGYQLPVNARLVQLIISGGSTTPPLIKVSLYGNQSLQKGHAWKHILLFILGKIIAFTTLGLLVWFLGKEIQQILTLYFPWLRKIIGPLLILMGLMLAGIIKGRSFFSIKFIRKQNEVGSFLLGFSFP